MKILVSLITATLLLISTSSFADNCEQAAYFYKKGQYRSARTILDPLLIKGETCAEYYMGVMYEKGAGVKKTEKNRIKGVSLIESAAKKGYSEAIKFMKSYH